jgi:Ca-activated chloride channel family protein
MSFELHWVRPLWLWLLPLVALFLALLVLRARQSRRWEALVDAALRPFVLTGARGARPGPLLAALALGWTLVALALAGPAWELAARPVLRIEQPRVLLLDLSVSMQALDVAPSRVARARFEVMDLLRGTDEGQFALIAFGAEPFLIAPLTTDAGTILEQVPLLEPAVLPVTGERRSDLALEAARRLLQRSAAAAADVILITDAVAPEDRTRDMAAELAAAGHRVSVLAVVPHAGFDALAAAGGGVVAAARPDDLDTARLLALQGPARADAAGEIVSLERQWRDDGPWLVLLVLPLAALAFRRGWLAAVAFAALLTPAPPVQAGLWADLWLRPEQRAVRDADAGRLTAALDGIEDRRWRAALHYRAGDYSGALEALAGLRGPEAHYNRGNALARLGRFDDAVAEYDAALALAPGHADARHNRRLLLGLMQEPGSPPAPAVPGEQMDRPHARGGVAAGDGSGPGDDVAGVSGSDQGRGRVEALVAPAQRQRVDAAEEHSGADAGDGTGRQVDAVPALTRVAGPSAERSPAVGPPGAEDLSTAAEGPPPSTSRSGAGDTAGTSAWQSEPSRAPAADADAAADAYLLRQVPDDPGRLLRERLMLQYLRRHGRLH